MRGSWRSAGEPVTAIRRYLRLLAIQVRISAALAMQYRLDFFFKGAMASSGWGSRWCRCWWCSQAASVAGWTWPEALVVLGWFSLLKAVLEGASPPASPRWSRGCAPARSTSCCSSRPTPSSWSRPRGSSPGGWWTCAARSGCCLRLRQLGRWPSLRPRGHGRYLAGGGGAAALLDLDPGGQRLVLGGPRRQPLLPVQSIFDAAAGPSTCSGASRCASSSRWCSRWRC